MLNEREQFIYQRRLSRRKLMAQAALAVEATTGAGIVWYLISHQDGPPLTPGPTQRIIDTMIKDPNRLVGQDLQLKNVYAFTLSQTVNSQNPTITNVDLAHFPNFQAAQKGLHQFEYNWGVVSDYALLQTMQTQTPNGPSPNIPSLNSVDTIAAYNFSVIWRKQNPTATNSNVYYYFAPSKIQLLAQLQ